ncbi:MAG: hypothetical protein V1790_17775 [Planctomycetota bacterium]
MRTRRPAATLRERILSKTMPIGGRFCDRPVTDDDRRWYERFLRQVERLEMARRELLPSWNVRKPDWFALELAITKATGLQPTYDLARLAGLTADRLIVNAAGMKREDRDELLSMIRSEVRQVESAVVGTVKPNTVEHYILVALLENQGQRA